jgi:hypothetical protein
MPKCIKQLGVIQFWMHKNKTPIRIYWWLLTFYGNVMVNVSTVHCWVRKSWYSSDGNLGLNDQPLSGRPVSATYNLNRQKVDKLIQENWQISKRVSEEKLNIGFASVNDTAAVWVTRSVCLMGAVYLMLEMKRKTGCIALITHSVWKWAIIYFQFCQKGRELGTSLDLELKKFYTERFEKLVQCWKCCTEVRDTMWKKEVHKHSAHSELYFVFFILTTCLIKMEALLSKHIPYITKWVTDCRLNIYIYI